MADLTVSEAMSLFLQTLDLQEYYNGEVLLLFGQNMGLRQPVIKDPKTKKTLALELKRIAEPMLDHPELGGEVTIHFHDGIITKVEAISKRLPAPPSTPFRLNRTYFLSCLLRITGRDWITILKENKDSKISLLLAEFNKSKLLLQEKA